MPRGMNASTYFSSIPRTLDTRRSSFPLEQDITTAFNAGQLIPFASFYEVLPGDTWNIDLSLAVRLATPIHPTFGDAYLDVYWFYCPNRILWTHWKEFLGENTTGPWHPNVSYTVPQHHFPSGALGGIYSLWDYFGLPCVGYGEGGHWPTVSSLPFRAYEAIWSEWFRSTAVQNPAKLYKGDNYTSGRVAAPGGEFESFDNTAGGGSPFPVDRLHDYFSSALPEPQYGPALTLQAGQLLADGPFSLSTSNGQQFGLQLQNVSGGTQIWRTAGSPLSAAYDQNMTYQSGLKIDWTTTVNDLRIFFQTQKFQEKLAFGGSRYREIIHTLFGVYPPDSSIQIPEYLGGVRTKIGMQQVLQTSSTDQTSPQGNTAAFSFTANSSHQFTRSFSEHGILMAVCCVRTASIYTQGVARKWSRKEFLDYYNPVFANIGNMPILNQELFCKDGDPTNDEIFGYQEAWADYRYHPNFATSYMRPEAPNTLASWNYADYYTERPVLNDAWMRSPAKTNLDRTLAVTSKNGPQFIGEFLVTGTVSRVMPTFSVPGLLDHH